MTTAHIPSGLMNIWSTLAGPTCFQVVQEIALQDYSWQPGKARGAVQAKAGKNNFSKLKEQPSEDAQLKFKY